jgi:excinuclease UvrABC nuclease subunit
MMRMTSICEKTCAKQEEKEKEFKMKVDEQVERLTQSLAKAQKVVTQLEQEMASPMQGEVAAGHRERITALEVSASCSDSVFEYLA